MAGRKYGANVFEMANRSALETINTATIPDIVLEFSAHESLSSTNAHQISNISGLQTALNGKQNVISGYTGNVSVVVGVDFTAKTISTVKIKIVNGIITEIN